MARSMCARRHGDRSFSFRSFISYLRALVPLHKRKVASVGIYPSIRTSQRLIDHISVYVTLR
jgi:hypothetical protein